MSKRAGALNWRRMVVEVPNQIGGVDVDTGLTLPAQERAFLANSENEPRFDLDGVVGSRIQVIPLAPLTEWFATNPVTHGEPFLDPATDTIHVHFYPRSTGGEQGVVVASTLNVLFWNPHSSIGPGMAEPYGMVE